MYLNFLPESKNELSNYLSLLNLFFPNLRSVSRLLNSISVSGPSPKTSTQTLAQHKSTLHTDTAIATDLFFIKLNQRSYHEILLKPMS